MEYTSDTAIFLLMSQKEKRARGFGDLKRTFTFAFTAKDKAEAFVKEARTVGMLLDVDLLYPMTVGEYFKWKKEGKTEADLAFDPDKDLLKHPSFTGMRFGQN
jgi:hypothetical protein